MSGRSGFDLRMFLDHIWRIQIPACRGLVIESYGGYGPQFNVFTAELRIIARDHLTLTNGESIINDMLNQIALHVISLNGMTVIMKAAIASQEA